MNTNDVGFDSTGGGGAVIGRNDMDSVPGSVSAANDPTGVLSPGLTPAEADARLLATLNNWWFESRDAHAANRRNQHIDADFYDHEQLDPEHRRDMEARGQAPLTYNLVKSAIDWVIGSERRTRIDWKINPRGKEDQPAAVAKGFALKYIDDVNNGSFARSAAFTHAVKVGIGWLEDCVMPGGDDEPITHRHEDWKVMWWDPFARELDLRDARYLERVKWLDVDYALTMHPKFAGALLRAARATDEMDGEDMQDPADVPGLFFNRSSHSYDTLRTDGSGYTLGRRLRNRVRIIETWYRKPVAVQRMSSLDETLERGIYDATNPKHADAVNSGMTTLYPGTSEEIWCAMWIPGTLLSNKKSPYKHKRYPFTPVFAYRNDKNNLPYGLIRGMRDAQDDYNKRRAKALFLLSTNRLIYEAGAIDAEDEQDFLDEAAAPNAQLRVNNGTLSQKRLIFESGKDMAASQLALMEQSKLHVYEGNGVTRENLGQDRTTAISGRAILAKQQQGAVTTAELFDNYRFTIHMSGKKELSNIEQFMTLPKRIRIVGPQGVIDWMTVNEPNIDPMTGAVIFNNDMAATEADFYVDQQDYRETTRMAMAEALFETLKGLDPTIQIQLLDLAIDLSDLPNREEFVRRIRKINGQGEPGEPETPEAIAAKQAQAQQAADAQQAALDEQKANTRHKNAQALKAETEARVKNVDAKTAALQAAHLLAGSVALAPAADRLGEFPDPVVRATAAQPDSEVPATLPPPTAAPTALTPA